MKNTKDLRVIADALQADPELRSDATAHTIAERLRFSAEIGEDPIFVLAEMLETALISRKRLLEDATKAVVGKAPAAMMVCGLCAAKMMG